MKRFLVFAGEYYDAGIGGWNNFRKSFDTWEEAKACAESIENQWNWSQVVDLETETEIE